MQEIPTFLHQMLLKQYKPDEVEKILQGYSNKRLVTLRVNLIKSNINEIKQILFDNNIKYETVNWDENALIIRENREDSITTLDIYKEGKIY